MRNVSLLVAVLGVTVRAVFAAELPLGHPDSMPSPARPVGWRGDGSGRFPGATPVTTWNLKARSAVSGQVRSTGSGQAGSNVIWQTRLPFFSASGPIVVGTRVFTTAEPDLLICLDAATGKERWRRHRAVFMEAFQAEIAVLAVERGVDLKNVRAMYQEVGSVGDKKMQERRTPQPGKSGSH